MGTLAPKLQRIREVARSHYGKHEDPMGSNRGSQIDPFRPPWKRAELERADKEARRRVPGDPWCGWSATSILHEALGCHLLGAQLGSCYAIALAARRRGLWLDLSPGILDVDAGFVAYPGCLFVMLDRPLDAGHSHGHTGIVDAVSHDGLEVGTSEGNTGHKYGPGRRSLRDPRMRGIVLVDGLEHLESDWPRGLIEGPDLSHAGTR